MNLKSEIDIIWIEQRARINASINGNFVASILLPNKNRNKFVISGIYELQVREKFRVHNTLENAKKSIINVYLGLEEKPDDFIVSCQMKAWNGKDWILKDEDYQNAKLGLGEYCSSRFGSAVSHGADIAGRTEAAVYLTSTNMTNNGYVLRLDLFDNTSNSISKISINEAPTGLLLTK